MKTLTRKFIVNLTFGIIFSHLIVLSNQIKASEDSDTNQVITEEERNEGGGFLKLGIGYRYQKGPYSKKMRSSTSKYQPKNLLNRPLTFTEENVFNLSFTPI